MLGCRKSFSLLSLLPLILLIYGNLNGEVHAKSAPKGVYFEDIQVDYLNESYFDPETFDLSIDFRPDGKNALTYTADILRDAPADMRLKCTASARVFGNYIPTGLSIDGEMCLNVGYMKEYINRLLDPLGLHCPLKKGKYHQEGYIIDLTGLPVNLVSGTHLLFDILTYTNDGAQMFIMKAYVVL
ncbi:uncharacterized protein LOC131663200 [Phymastichus coffea]|uniref:uncharacterized protein LOC131663200 n=1 Tax=Phymastichus coffea TaxID=108790 RepID=UPI00273B6A68|nr:uncharacterized protein LOC131663200 [Phymastichus coffea]